MRTHDSHDPWEEFNATPVDRLVQLESERDEWRRLALALAEDWDQVESDYEELAARFRRLEEYVEGLAR